MGTPAASLPRCPNGVLRPPQAPLIVPANEPADHHLFVWCELLGFTVCSCQGQMPGRNKKLSIRAAYFGNVRRWHVRQATKWYRQLITSVWDKRLDTGCTRLL